MIIGKPRIREHLQKMKAYPVGESKGSGDYRVINLASNENPHQPSDAVTQALIRQNLEANRYSDNSCIEITNALAKKYKLNSENIICGNGSAELILLLAEAYAGLGDEVVIWQHGYLLYQAAANRVGATIKRACGESFLDRKALLKAISPKTKLIFIDNPNNPTGAHLNSSELRGLLSELPSSILCVIDAAYSDYVTAENYEDGLVLLKEYNNVCVLHTFSKIYGLAGARIGWMAGPADIVATLRAMQQPASVSRYSQAAALCALEEEDRIKAFKNENKIQREAFINFTKEIGLKPYPSEANFVLLDFENPRRATDIFKELKRIGIILRPMEPYQLSSCLRVTIGLPDDMQILSEKLGIL